MDPDEILLDAEERMEKAVHVVQNQLQGLRTGRATPGLVDSIRVDCYGSPTPLKQIATISVPEPQQIMIRPFDQVGRSRDSAQYPAPLDRTPEAIGLTAKGLGGRRSRRHSQRSPRCQQARRCRA